MAGFFVYYQTPAGRQNKTMNANLTEENSVPESRFDLIKWILVALLVSAAVVGNATLVQWPLAVRVIGVIVLALIAGFIALKTSKGVQLVSFSRLSYLEIRKVVWPTRQETLHTTLYVLVATLIAAVFLWMIDWVLMHAVALITGQGV